MLGLSRISWRAQSFADGENQRTRRVAMNVGLSDVNDSPHAWRMIDQEGHIVGCGGQRDAIMYWKKESNE